MTPVVTMQQSLEAIGEILVDELHSRGIKTTVEDKDPTEYPISQWNQITVIVPWNSLERILPFNEYRKKVANRIAKELATKIVRTNKNVVFVPMICPNVCFEAASIRNNDVSLRGLTSYNLQEDKVFTRYDTLVRWENIKVDARH